MKNVANVIVLIFLMQTTLFSFETEDIDVPLEYNYFPGEMYWAKFGAIDARPLALWIADLEIPTLGTIYDDGENVQYTLIPDDNCREYFDDAVYSVLTRYGVKFDESSPWKLQIANFSIRISQISGDDDQCMCKIVLQAVVFDSTTEYLKTYIENSGIDNIDLDDASSYSELINKTLHGALVKLWASQVLYTNKVLGTGTIRKTFSGTYAFFPGDSIPMEPSPVVPSMFRVNESPASVQINSEKAIESAGITAGVDSSAAFYKGSRITLGILPFENATGHEDLGVVIKSAQQVFQQVLSEAATVRVVERERLADILKEQALGLSGIISDSSAVEVGNISGVQVMGSVTVTVSGGYYRVNARLINVETSQVVAEASIKVPDATALEEGAAECAAELLFKFTEEKIAINRSSVPYPSVLPQVISATAASIEDAWAVAYNPAALMKVKQRDVVFFLTSSEFFSGKIGSENVTTRQPLWSDLGMYASVPIGSWFASGFGIRHCYPYPRIEVSVADGVYKIKEEKTTFSIPAAFGFTPKLSFGCTFNAHVGEYQIYTPGVSSIDGDPVSLDVTSGILWKFSQRFKIGLTYSSADLYASTKEKKEGIVYKVDNPSPHTLRFGTAMYPLKWIFLFADLEYEKYPQKVQYQPGFDLGAQFTKYVLKSGVPFFPQYSMLPLYIGYTHRPYNRINNTQQQYFSIGAGYYLNNVHFQWALRRNVGKENSRTFAIGKKDASVLVTNVKYTAPLYFSIGYRF
ncbi:MAG TPA: CsgG/HfaB family protein [Chitinispirillaceae bacterium]|nr:CsgG/HfaB family protein [Chitinispirillaceae bacterium]